MTKRKVVSKECTGMHKDDDQVASIKDDYRGEKVMMARDCSRSEETYTTGRLYRSPFE
jgi:hypothetical protein